VPFDTQASFACPVSAQATSRELSLSVTARAPARAPAGFSSRPRRLCTPFSDRCDNRGKGASTIVSNPTDPHRQASERIYIAVGTVPARQSPLTRFASPANPQDDESRPPSTGHGARSVFPRFARLRGPGAVARPDAGRRDAVGRPDAGRRGSVGGPDGRRGQDVLLGDQGVRGLRQRRVGVRGLRSRVPARETARPRRAPGGSRTCAPTPPRATASATASRRGCRR
jgi:hypothetical protein